MEAFNLTHSLLLHCLTASLSHSPLYSPSHTQPFLHSLSHFLPPSPPSSTPSFSHHHLPSSYPLLLLFFFRLAISLLLSYSPSLVPFLTPSFVPSLAVPYGVLTCVFTLPCLYLFICCIEGGRKTQNYKG